MGVYPHIEPYAHGVLDVGDSNLVYWETCGNPEGKPALVLHGGPGSGCAPWFRTLFDPKVYRVVLFDQRGCGRSTPSAGEPNTDLSVNTTWHLIADIERLRRHLNVDRWLVLGGSWGSTLALAYAETHPAQVTEMVLFGVTTGRWQEFDWWFRGGAASSFPEQWKRLAEHLPALESSSDVPKAYAKLLSASDPLIRRRAAEEWCRWESTTAESPPTHRLAPRYTDPHFAATFARLVTHYVSHNAWLEDGILHRNAGAIAAIPGRMISGRMDFLAPMGWATEFGRLWPRSKQVIVEDGSHAGETVEQAIVAATDEFGAALERNA